MKQTRGFVAVYIILIIVTAGVIGAAVYWYLNPVGEVTDGTDQPAASPAADIFKPPETPYTVSVSYESDDTEISQTTRTLAYESSTSWALTVKNGDETTESIYTGTAYYHKDGKSWQKQTVEQADQAAYQSETDGLVPSAAELSLYQKAKKQDERTCGESPCTAYTLNDTDGRKVTIIVNNNDKTLFQVITETDQLKTVRQFDFDTAVSLTPPAEAATSESDE